MYCIYKYILRFNALSCKIMYTLGQFKQCIYLANIIFIQTKIYWFYTQYIGLYKIYWFPNKIFQRTFKCKKSDNFEKVMKNGKSNEKSKK